MDMKNIGVVGAGTMGTGIAQVAATSGLTVVLHDVEDDFLKRSLAIMDKSLSKLKERGKIEEDKEAILGRITTTKNLEDFREADIAIEAAFEVNVVRVNTIRMLGKRRRLRMQIGRRSGWKKAIITLAEGQSIPLY